MSTLAMIVVVFGSLAGLLASATGITFLLGASPSSGRREMLVIKSAMVALAATQVLALIAAAIAVGLGKPWLASVAAASPVAVALALFALLLLLQ